VTGTCLHCGRPLEWFDGSWVDDFGRADCPADSDGAPHEPDDPFLVASMLGLTGFDL